ncbi:membrane hypothetical protein [Magnetospirillum sp. LM-5]|nr:membrane hypothetical protein [Magnetospirillum sp. LM-5]
MQLSHRRAMTIIGAAALFLAVAASAYDLFAGWPSRYKGGVLYDRMVSEHIVDSVTAGALFIALPLILLLYQLFGYDRLVTALSSPKRRKLGDALFYTATIVALGLGVLSGGILLIQFLMETGPH